MNYGESTLTLVQQAIDGGADHVVLLMRHSAREFAPDIHDLENPLTEAGRELALDLGRRLDRSLLLRGYASPAARCVDTANLILEGHRSADGEVTRTRPVEGLGVFYVLDQMKMFRIMQAAEGQQPFLEHWFAGGVPGDVMMPADLAARLVAQVAAEKLNQALEKPQLDILVTHDMTLYTVRDRLLGQSIGEFGDIEFLDGLILFRRGGRLLMQSHHGEAETIHIN
ncbi:MAG: histidine phosphatase family protein [Pseudomonadales bacterium]|nr:histidine phosphatase family protein [Pseudomonadales bacterium]